MEFRYKFQKGSSIESTSAETQMSFSPDLNREPTFFLSNLKEKLPFREAMSALHAVVASDMRYRPKDRSDYMAWLASQEKIWLAELVAQKEKHQNVYDHLKEELNKIKAKEQKILKPFYDAQSRYFDYLYKNDYDKWFVLDPVITVHPDELFFEAFSQDESSYAKLSCSYDAFEKIEEQAYGTTNIDYSHALYDEFQKIRSYKATKLMIDPSGFEVHSEHAESFKEEKIDLPDSWVRGFLQISAAMGMQKVSFDLHPMDIYNILLFLRRNKEKESPRSLRFHLYEGKPVEVTLDPWGKKMRFPRSIFKGAGEHNIRIWGRRRLFVLERLLSVAKSFKVSLLGTGMPSFWEADIGSMHFTLGLSGWSANDWSASSNFDLLMPRAEVDEMTAKQIFEQLQKSHVANSETLSRKLGFEKSIVESALGIYAQHGRVLYDMRNGLYRLREFSAEPIGIDKIRFKNEQEKKASQIIYANGVGIKEVTFAQNVTTIQGEVKEKSRHYSVRVGIDDDMRLVDAQCECWFFRQNRLRRGPCEHMLALRLKYERREDGVRG